MNEQRWHRVGPAVRDRRLELGLTIEEAAERATISTAVWDVVEHVRRTRFSPKTIRGVGRALAWEADWLDRLLGDLDPQRWVAEEARVLLDVRRIDRQEQQDAFSLDERLARLPARERELAKAQVSALLDVLEAQVRESGS